MPNGRADVMAQAVYLAQLSAARGQCKCEACRILRKATKDMTTQFLNPNSGGPRDVEESINLASSASPDVIGLEEEE